MAVLAPARKVKEQIECYRRLQRQLQLFCSTPIVAFDEHTAIEFQSLRRRYPRLGAFDLKIAAIALVNKATLLSRNLRHFGQISGLDVQDWTEPIKDLARPKTDSEERQS
jgi:tRNA(fMet)-specific endonuclease VapC